MIIHPERIALLKSLIPHAIPSILDGIMRPFTLHVCGKVYDIWLVHLVALKVEVFKTLKVGACVARTDYVCHFCLVERPQLN